MHISLPRESVFYYECSAGEFRLVLFLPAAHLKELVRRKRISEQVVLDFPDGVDLGCTRADFADFEGLYGWRPPIDPVRICDAFYAVYSSTRQWKSFRGSGLIPATDLERHLGRVESAVEAEEPAAAEGAPASVGQRRRRRSRHARNQRALEQMKVPKIDRRKDLRQQAFSEVAWSKGESAAAVFSRLHERRS